MSNRALAFVVMLPIAGLIGFAAGRATTNVGTVAEAWSPDGASRVTVDRAFSTGPRKQAVRIASGGRGRRSARARGWRGAGGRALVA